jgi:hypothetical protein
MNYAELDIDRKMLVAGTLESLMRARQAAYQAAREIPEMRPVFEAAEAIYADLAARVGARYAPVFDEAEYIERKIERGDRDHTFVRDMTTGTRRP